MCQSYQCLKCKDFKTGLSDLAKMAFNILIQRNDVFDVYFYQNNDFDISRRIGHYGRIQLPFEKLHIPAGWFLMKTNQHDIRSVSQ